MVRRQTIPPRQAFGRGASGLLLATNAVLLLSVLPFGCHKSITADTVPNTSEAHAAPKDPKVASVEKLALACREGDIKTVSRLLARKPDVNRRTSDGRTPLHLASELQEPLIAAMLLHAGADPSVPASDGTLPIEVLIRNAFAPKSARSSQYAAIIQARMQRGIDWLLTQGEVLLKRGFEVEALRQRLIEEDRLDREAMLEQIAPYLVETSPAPGWENPHSITYMGVPLDERPLTARSMSQLIPRPKKEYHARPIPEELTTPLKLPPPPQFAQADAFLSYALTLAALTYGAEDPRFEDVKRRIAKMMP